MKTNIENVLIVSDDSGEMISIVRRDPSSQKNLIFMMTDAKMDDISLLITGNKINDKIKADPEEV
jgi:hypothetical protein